MTTTQGITDTLARLDREQARDFCRTDHRDALPMTRLSEELREALQGAPDLEGIDHEGLTSWYRYDGMSVPAAQTLAQFGYRWIACYPVTGGNEGHYVHVDLIQGYPTNAGHLRIVPLFLIKTFAGHEAACAIARACARILGS